MKNIYLFIALSLTFISCNTESQETTDKGLNERKYIESNDFNRG